MDLSSKKRKKSIKGKAKSVNQDHHINMLSSLATLATRTSRQLRTIPRQRLFNNNIYAASSASKAFSSQPASNKRWRNKYGDIDIIFE